MAGSKVKPSLTVETGAMIIVMRSVGGQALRYHDQARGLKIYIGESGVYCGAGTLRTNDKGWSDAGQMFRGQILVTRSRAADTLESENR